MNKLTEIEIINRFKALAIEDKNSPILGIGDDCAVIPSSKTNCTVITCDTLTEDTHFILDRTTPEQLAYKALASNISDVISMGAMPRFAFLALTFSSKIDMDWIDRFSESFAKLSQKYNISLLGGDTTFSKHAVTISITLQGEVELKNIKYRSAAEVGDSIFCLSELGGSALGLHHILTSSAPHPSIERHYKPRLFVEESLWLAGQDGVGAMMDISDGIAKDITHIASQSRVGVRINLDKIPIYPEATLKMAIEGGEEYSPLFTVRAERVEHIKNQYRAKFGCDMYEIGTITQTGGVEWYQNGEKIDYKFKGYEHVTDR